MILEHLRKAYLPALPDVWSNQEFRFDKENLLMRAWWSPASVAMPRLTDQRVVVGVRKAIRPKCSWGRRP